MVYIILLSALLPAFVLVWLIYRKDKLQPEPISQIIKAALWGVASVFVSFFFSIPLTILFGEGTGIGFVDSAYTAFCLAAIPEEVAKLLCLFLFLRKNKYFDEYMDGIVYAVCVSMGFAGIENILYLFNAENWAALGVTRALISVPGHYAFAVLMGYYYSHWHMLKDQKSKLLMLAAPILAHGIFDFLLMWAPYAESLYTILTLVFFIFLSKMHKYCSKLVARQREIDIALMATHSHQDASTGDTHTQNA